VSLHNLLLCMLKKELILKSYEILNKHSIIREAVVLE